MYRKLYLISALLLLSCSSDGVQFVPCETTDDCPSGKTCYIYGGFCTKGCMATEECSQGEDCYWTTEFDYSKSTGWNGPGFCDPHCNDNPSVCKGGTVCDTSSSLCIPKCHDHSDCGERFCSGAGKCIDCLEDEDCPTSYTCTASGSCKAPCKTFCSCTCSCGTATISSNMCMNCTSECSSTCADMCGGW